MKTRASRQVSPHARKWLGRPSYTVAIGTDDPVAPYHQLGTRRMPKRLLIPDDILAEDQRYIADLVAAYLAGTP